MSRPVQTFLFSDSPLPRPPSVDEAVRGLAEEGNLEERGAVYTAPAVVEAILDLCEYTPDRDLAALRLLEPSFGNGDFLIPAVDRLLDSFRRHHSGDTPCPDQLREAIRGVELHKDTFVGSRSRLRERLVGAGLGDAVEELLDAWLVNDDFLLAEGLGEFDVVVGNPPYVRQERVPGPLLATYRERFDTFVHRADLYVLFYERGLNLLAPDGRLGYICSNRWVRNQYGGALRAMIGRGFHLEYFIDLERADAFQASVIAYPAITVIKRARGKATLLSVGGRESTVGLESIVEDLRAVARGESGGSRGISAVHVAGANKDPWLLECPEVVEHLRTIEREFPTLEESGAKVGIGVATGADGIFIGPLEDLPVEPERKLPLAMAADCGGVEVEWGGLGVVNPYLESGDLASLDEFPEFGAYMRLHRDALTRRHTAQQRPRRWYKTIDRIYPSLTDTPKLLIPDIKGDATVTLDRGRYYPHHNLYVVTSSEWDLLALKAVLRSSLAVAFVAAYAPRMSGGFLRFQAQYLRRIRCPRWSDLAAAQRARLSEVANSDLEECDDAVFEALQMDRRTAHAIQRFAGAARVKGRTS